MAIDGKFLGYFHGTCVKLYRGQYQKTPPFVFCPQRVSDQPLLSVREYRSAPLPGQPVLDEADVDTRTDAGMLWFLHVLLLKSDAEDTICKYSEAAGINIRKIWSFRNCEHHFATKYFNSLINISDQTWRRLHCCPVAVMQMLDQCAQQQSMTKVSAMFY